MITSTAGLVPLIVYTLAVYVLGYLVGAMVQAVRDQAGGQFPRLLTVVVSVLFILLCSYAGLAVLRGAL